MSTKTVLITGASSGFGKLTAKTFQQHGWNVVATMRSPQKEQELDQLENLALARLDVTDPESIDNAVNSALERFGGIDVLVNNAGFGGFGLLEQVSDERVRSMFDTNVFGVMNVSRAVLPQMRKQGHGCIINVTSMGGMIGVPLMSVYVSSKFAVEGLTEAMAYDYEPLGIKVKSVLPGAYPTTRFNASIDDDLSVEDEQLTAHASRLHSHMGIAVEQLASHGGKASDPQEVADKIFQCATSETPVQNPVGADAEMWVEMLNKGNRQEFLDQFKQIAMPQVAEE